MLKLKPLQQQLERIYAVAVEHDIDDFVITDAQLVERLDDSDYARQVEEKLLVRQLDDSVDLALYLDAAVVTRLAQDNPTRRLHDGNLVDFCTALEGVSHFLYLTWNASQGRSVTHLELEMQAEVDKYITILSLFGQQRRRRLPSRLHRWLFEQPFFDPRLAEFERVRYRDANHYAGKYCHQLENRYLRPSPPQGARLDLVDELRHFYRLPLRDKIRRIDYEYMN